MAVIASLMAAFATQQLLMDEMLARVLLVNYIDTFEPLFLHKLSPFQRVAEQRKNSVIVASICEIKLMLHNYLLKG
jgi:hypothetical protein